mmetsp:Transcript_56713/g.120416  ORF Transcript_56713/g.120416 Transcript_56713/m.120416 type:complete len:208 (+) Transcript_56713:398-1021(+)
MGQLERRRCWLVVRCRSVRLQRETQGTPRGPCRSVRFRCEMQGTPRERTRQTTSSRRSRQGQIHHLFGRHEIGSRRRPRRGFDRRSQVRARRRQAPTRPARLDIPQAAPRQNVRLLALRGSRERDPPHQASGTRRRRPPRRQGGEEPQGYREGDPRRRRGGPGEGRSSRLHERRHVAARCGTLLPHGRVRDRGSDRVGPRREQAQAQ